MKWVQRSLRETVTHVPGRRHAVHGLRNSNRSAIPHLGGEIMATRIERACEALLRPERLYALGELQADRSLPPAAAGAYAWYFKAIPNGVPPRGCHRTRRLPLLLRRDLAGSARQQVQSAIPDPVPLRGQRLGLDAQEIDRLLAGQGATDSS